MVPADVAWMLVATALVLLMTPALAFFYGGLVRSKNALNTMMMSFVALGFVGVAWALVGYSLAFARRERLARRTLDVLPLQGRRARSERARSRTSSSWRFQATFAHHHRRAHLRRDRRADALRRLRRLHHAVVARASMPDRALGVGRRLAVHAGRARLRRRHGRPRERRRRGARGRGGARPAEGLRAAGDPPAQRAVHAARRRPALVRVVRLQRRQRARARTTSAALAFVNTMLAPAATLVVWSLLDMTRNEQGDRGRCGDRHRRRTGRDHAGGRFRQPAQRARARRHRARSRATSRSSVERETRLDDSLDVIAAHGVGGTVGALLTGVFAQKAWNGVADGAAVRQPVSGGHSGDLRSRSVIVYGAVATFVLLKAHRRWSCRCAPRRDDEGLGLDVTQHGEEAYTRGEGAILVLPERRAPAVAAPVRLSAEGGRA